MPKDAGRRNGQEGADREGNGIEDEITDRVTGTDRRSDRDRPYERRGLLTMIAKGCGENVCT